MMLASTFSGFHFVGVHVSLEALHLLHVGQDFHAVAFAQELFRNSSCGDAANRFARTATSPTLPIANAIFGEICVVGMRRPELGGHLRIRFGTRIFIADPQANRGAQGLAIEDAGEDLHRVRFPAWRDNFGLPRTPAVEVRLNVGFAQSEPRRAAIHHHAHTAAVRFTPGRNPKQMAESIAHARAVWRKRDGRSNRGKD